MTTRYKNKKEDIRFFIVETQVESVLSGETCLKLGLLKRMYKLGAQESSEKSVRLEDYPELFTGLGCLPGEYKIQLKENAQPVVHPLRKAMVLLR